VSRRETNARLRDPITVRSNLSRFLNTIIIIPTVSFGLYPTLSPYYQALFCYLTTSPVPTCLVHNCETSQGLLDFHLLSSLFWDQIPFDPHQWAFDWWGFGTDPLLKFSKNCRRASTNWLLMGLWSVTTDGVWNTGVGTGMRASTQSRLSST